MPRTQKEGVLSCSCWVGHKGCVYGDLQQSQHCTWMDPVPVTSRHKKVTFLLYLDIWDHNPRRLAYPKGLLSVYQEYAEALLPADWKVTHRTALPSCPHTQTWPSPLPSTLGEISAFSSWAVTTVHTTGCWLAASGELSACQTTPSHQSFQWMSVILYPRKCDFSASLLLHGLTLW